jgi:hypothetical protein
MENTLAYYETAKIIAVKMFLLHALGANPIKLYSALIS